jgi:hypothetical protein
MAQALTDDQARYLMENGLRRVFRADPAAGHQIVVRLSASARLTVSCTCLGVPGCKGGIRYEPIETRQSWLPGEAVRAWREHLPAEGQEAAES